MNMHLFLYSISLVPFLAWEFSLVVFVLFIDFGSCAVGGFGQVKVDEKARDENDCGKEPKATLEGRRACNGKDSTNHSSPKPVGKGCQRIGLAAVSQGEHFGANHPDDWAPGIRKTDHVHCAE